MIYLQLFSFLLETGAVERECNATSAVLTGFSLRSLIHSTFLKKHKMIPKLRSEIPKVLNQHSSDLVNMRRSLFLTVTPSVNVCGNDSSGSGTV